ncbi:sugar phosphate isomerase/epimerase family protein [Cohnella hongkongensis]|uniref:Sugar phosphate isomerase/epimerase family protein n=1 Tax=Cohnella hongkongensis TaxID=178337 RepID=A0ABV9F833_9BACL
MKIVLGGNMYDDATMEQFIQDAGDIGYEGVELRGVGEWREAKYALSKAHEVKKLLQENRVAATNLSLFVGNFCCNSEQENEAEYAKWLDYLAFAEVIGCGMMRLNPGFQHSDEADRSDFNRSVKWFQKCAEAADELQIKTVVEMHHGTLCDSAESSIRFMEAVARSNVGLILDPVNLYQVPAEYGMEAIRLIRPYLLNVHVKDIVELWGPRYPWAFEYGDYVAHIGQYHRVIPRKFEGPSKYYCHRLMNQGGIDWHEVIGALAEVGYSGPLTVESVSKKGSELPQYRELAAYSYRELMETLARTGVKPGSGERIR